MSEQSPQVIYVKQSGNGLAVAALCVGLAAVLFGGAMYILFPIALGLGAIAVVLGFLGRSKAKRDPEAGRKTMATWGVVLGFIAIGIGIVGAVVVQNAVDDVDKSFQQLDSYSQCIDQADTAAEMDAC